MDTLSLFMRYLRPMYFAEEGAGGDEGAGENKWREGLDEDIRSHPSLDKYGSLEDVAKAYVGVQPLIGMDKLPLPKDLTKATPEEWSEIFNRLGRPATAGDYKVSELERPEGYPAASVDEMKALSEKAFELGILPTQLNGLYEYFMTGEFAKFAQGKEDATKAHDVAKSTLMKEWGRAYDEKLAKANALLKTGGEGMDSFIAEHGNDPRLIKFLAGVAGKFSEDGLSGEPRGATMTPEEADMEIKKIMGDKTNPYWIKNHPEHQVMLDKMAALHRARHPE